MKKVNFLKKLFPVLEKKYYMSILPIRKIFKNGSIEIYNSERDIICFSVEFVFKFKVAHKLTISKQKCYIERELCLQKRRKCDDNYDFKKALKEFVFEDYPCIKRNIKLVKDLAFYSDNSTIDMDDLFDIINNFSPKENNDDIRNIIRQYRSIPVYFPFIQEEEYEIDDGIADTKISAYGVDFTITPENSKIISDFLKNIGLLDVMIRRLSVEVLNNI